MMADVIVDAENKNPMELLGQGMRAYVLSDFESAVTALSKASELLVAEHKDDLHPSLGDVYLYYGKSLLELCREQSGPLGEVVPQTNEDESEDDEVDTTEVENGKNEEDEKAEENGEQETENEDKENAENKENGKDEEEEAAEPQASTSETEEEASDLQLAWEVLELAKKIFKKEGETKLKQLADTLIALGDVSLENGNFEGAINDMKEGVDILNTIYPNKDSRLAAESYYKLGTAYSTDSQIDEAVKSFGCAVLHLQNRLKSLEATGKSEDEVREIKELVPEIEDKIADMKSYKDETLKQIMSAVSDSKVSSTEAVSSSSPSSSSVGGASTSKPVNNISHLVKRKRKLDEILEGKEAEASPSKKAP